MKKRGVQDFQREVFEAVRALMKASFQVAGISLVRSLSSLCVFMHVNQIPWARH